MSSEFFGPDRACLVQVTVARSSLAEASASPRCETALTAAKAARPVIEVNPESYEVRADGELLACEPAEVLPLAQRYLLF